jgi:hypothetical protein
LICGLINGGPKQTSYFLLDVSFVKLKVCSV